MKSKKEIELNFTHYAVREVDVIAFLDLKDQCVSLASSIDMHCPESSEKDSALKRLEECNYWAKAAIVRAKQ